MTTTAKVEAIKRGEYVKRTADANKVFKRGPYCASTKCYALEDCSDISREVYVKRGTDLFINFEY